MILQSNCPQFDRLQALFDGTATKDVQQELAKHLDHCDECQRQFEQLASDPGFLQDVARSQSHEQGRQDKILQYLVHDLSARFRRAAEKNAETADKRQVPHDTLDFLEPSNNKQHLGRIDNYEVIEVIGRGGMGVVLKAVDPKLNRVVALKVIAPELACNAEARKRFFREAQAAAAVSHHHVVTLHAVDDSEKLPYLVMEYISGQSLHERIRRSGSLQLREILRIGRQTALGLAAAHAVGLVHRDLKPANILLENGIERVKLTDFGLARAADDVNLTQTGYVAGTPLYMSPEQAHSETLDARSDLFSLGSVLYTMCTGQPPFNAKSTYGVIRQVCEGSPRPIWDVNPDIPQWLVEIIDRLMAKDPDQRFQSASEVADLLAEHLVDLEQPKRARSFDFSETPAPLVKELPRRQPPKRRWSLLIASLLVVLGGLAVTEALGVTNVAELIATVLHIRTSHGTLVVEIDDPNVKVTVEGESEDIVISGLGEHEVRLRPGKHQWRAVHDGKPVRTEWVTITRGGKQVVRASRLEAPEAAAKAKSPPAPGEKPPVQGRPETPDRIETGDAEAVVLQESDDPNGWRTVPDFLKGAKIYSKWKRKTGAIIEFRVVRPGVVYLACHFGYEGNPSGGWQEEALTKEEFVANGWEDVAKMRSGQGRTHTVFRKACVEGEQFQLRCNKYSTPLVILVDEDEQAPVDNAGAINLQGDVAGGEVVDNGATPAANAYRRQLADLQSPEGQIPLCPLLQAGRMPEGFLVEAMKFTGPAGDGRSGAAGFVVQTKQLLDGDGSRLSFLFQRYGNGYGFQVIHPLGEGHVLVSVHLSVTIHRGGSWGTIGWGDPSTSDKVDIEDRGRKLLPLKANAKHAVTSELTPDGRYRLVIDDVLVCDQKIDAAAPLVLEIPKKDRFWGGSVWDRTPFAGEGFKPQLEPGHAGLILGPLDGPGGSQNFQDIHLSSAPE